jgi:hypothetical protein
MGENEEEGGIIPVRVEVLVGGSEQEYSLPLAWKTKQTNQEEREKKGELQIKTYLLPQTNPRPSIKRQENERVG